MMKYFENLNDFTEIVNQYQTKVRGICYGFLKNKEEAEDTAQDVFIEIFRSLKNFKGESSLSTWIYRIASTKSIDLLRSKKRKKRLVFLSRNTELDEIPAESSNISEVNELKKALEFAMNRIPENQRIALTLNKIDDFKIKEISEIMNTSPKAVESLLSRGKSNLRKQLEKHYEELFT